MKIKICGMRNSENIQEVIKLSPDYLGFIFYDKSKRHVIDFPELKIPKSIKKVGVVVNESIETILKYIQNYELDAIQLHGNETPEFCEKLKEIVTSSAVEKSHQDKILRQAQYDKKLEIIKAFSVDEHFDFEKAKAYEPFCELFIFDTKGKGYGGTGLKYDWNLLKKYKRETPFLLSGGIGPNDGTSIKEFNHRLCIGVDLNSGFEDAPGLKNKEKLQSFLNELKN
ncbi:phosphoribosylanthranilate isomerase [Urechidicola vernalis]|uniref:N-(5'-phosphoribosyl)anthranilate isomerase n=1 Tax=Urechidicola vernalis TaxID=3075600 RepID=A0ABU2Y3L2_9FLAO|nr:phosphoribosylanthranilate isomerase [Urechidicola sp. P050]MDT0552766.1 phosphoribosylanthranilate isomerase [Urechidicola sp. P050]